MKTTPFFLFFYKLINNGKGEVGEGGKGKEVSQFLTEIEEQSELTKVFFSFFLKNEDPG